MNHNLHRATLRYPRTLDSAFNTPRYASAIERPLPRKRPLLKWAAWILFAITCLSLIAFAK